jgi:hypothetical protein
MPFTAIFSVNEGKSQALTVAQPLHPCPPCTAISSVIEMK